MLQAQQMGRNCSYHVCGFNGFQQIEQCVSGLKTSSDNIEDNRSSKEESVYSLPQKMRVDDGTCIQHCRFTWSNIWIITDDRRINCFGSDNPEVSKIVAMRAGDIQDVIPAGLDTIFQMTQGTILVGDQGDVRQLSCDTDGVNLLAATGDSVLGTNDQGELFEGNIIVCDSHVRLVLHPLSVQLAVTMVSCGFEHTLILTKFGTIYAFGKGSRGQLGHGDLSVDTLSLPTLVQTLEGVHVIAIAAGGWHSTSVTDSGDLYVWGWNESGQLGLPNECISKNEPCISGNRRTNFSDLTDIERTPEPKCFTKDCQKPLSPPCTISDSVTDTACLSSFPRKRRLSSSDTNQRDVRVCLNPSENSPEKDKFSVNREVTDNLPLILRQDIDPVLVQTVPYGLDIPDDFSVRKVACGSRHTCVLLDTGHLMTAGWNTYGQLGQGDTSSRDYLQTVSYFVDRGEVVTDVQAGAWNTYIVSEKG